MSFSFYAGTGTIEKLCFLKKKKYIKDFNDCDFN